MNLVEAQVKLLSKQEHRFQFAREPDALADAFELEGVEREAFLQMDSVQIVLQAETLIGKRIHEVRKVIPQTFQNLGHTAADLFSHHANQTWPDGHRRHWEDALAFLDYLKANQPTFVCKIEFNRIRFLLSSRKAAMCFSWGNPFKSASALIAVQLLLKRGGKFGEWVWDITLPVKTTPPKGKIPIATVATAQTVQRLITDTEP